MMKQKIVLKATAFYISFYNVRLLVLKSDVHGHDMRVCRADDGVDSVMRFSLLRHRLATLLQPAWLPSFTREGFTVREVPGRLMGMINIARMKSMESMEEEQCVAEVACFNCQKLVQDKRECKVPQHSGKQMIIEITQQLKVYPGLQNDQPSLTK